MGSKKKNVSKLQIVLAVIGAGFCVLFVAGVVYAVVTTEEPAEPSELALHPEREDEILAERRARQYQQMLSLNEEQTDQVAQIVLSARKQEKQDLAKGYEDGRAMRDAKLQRRKAVSDQIEAILTPEQRVAYAQTEGKQRLDAIMRLRSMVHAINPDGGPRKFVQMMRQNNGEKAEQLKQHLQQSGITTENNEE